MAGVYGAVLVEGMLHKGDPVELLDLPDKSVATSLWGVGVESAKIVAASLARRARRSQSDGYRAGKSRFASPVSLREKTRGCETAKRLNPMFRRG